MFSLFPAFKEVFLSFATPTFPQDCYCFECVPTVGYAWPGETGGGSGDSGPDIRPPGFRPGLLAGQREPGTVFTSRSGGSGTLKDVIDMHFLCCNLRRGD